MCSLLYIPPKFKDTQNIQMFSGADMNDWTNSIRFSGHNTKVLQSSEYKSKHYSIFIKKIINAKPLHGIISQIGTMFRLLIQNAQVISIKFLLFILEHL